VPGVINFRGGNRAGVQKLLGKQKGIFVKLQENRGKQFDPRLTDLFLGSVDEAVDIMEMWPD